MRSLSHGRRAVTRPKMTDAKTGRLSPPPHYVPPPPAPPADAARTIRVALTDLLPWVVGSAVRGELVTSSTAEGLAAIRAKFRRTLERLGVPLEVFQAARVPMSGGMPLLWN